MTAWKRCHKKTNDNMRDKKIIMWNFWDKKKKILIKKITDKKRFWQTVKRFFSNKNLDSEQIILIIIRLIVINIAITVLFCNYSLADL